MFCDNCSQVAETEPNTALLLIVALLDETKLRTLMAACEERRVEPVLEVATEAEMDTALSVGGSVIGINNRDLNTFVVDESRAERLYRYGCSRAPTARFVAFSGIQSREQIDSSGLGSFLVGGSILSSADPAAKLAELTEPRR